MHYTYVLESTKKPGRYYRGCTRDIRTRLKDHNEGKNKATKSLRPWHIKFCAAFETPELARNFERYLKSGSGHAFAKHHLGL